MCDVRHIACFHYPNGAPKMTTSAVHAEPRTSAAVLVESLSKTFNGVRALKEATLEVRPGEIHALLGTNGSGKSTMIKVLSGFHKPDPGACIEIAGRPLTTGSPDESHAAGLRFIHQDLGLIDTLTVEENFNLTSSVSRRWVSPRREESRVASVFAEYDVHVDPAAVVATLSPTAKAIVAIIRAVEDRPDSGGIVVLDEPTAALPKDEVHQLFRIIKRLKEDGTTIVYVSHRMPEILEIADRVTVLRDGRTVARAEVRDHDLDSLIQLVLGYELRHDDVERLSAQAGPALLRISGLVGPGVQGFDLEARAGEVVGVTGLLGSGYEQVLGLAFGALDPTDGAIVLDGEDITKTDPLDRIRRGLAYAPADRRRFGSISEWTLRENLTLPAPPWAGFLRWMSKRTESADADGWLARMGVVPADPNRMFATMSGGNQQKIVMGRWLRAASNVLLLDEPTNGVDAAAKRAIHEALRASAANGAAVVVSSSDIEELIQVCDRVLVMGDGVVREEFGQGELTDDALNSAVMSATGSR